MQDYHSLFYYLVLSPLQGLIGNGGELSQHYRRQKESPDFAIGFEPRADRYEHTYMRDNFLATRDKLVLALPRRGDDYDSSVIILKESRKGDAITIYRRAVEYIFGEGHKEAFEELSKLLDKFYTVTVEDIAPYMVVDFSQDRYPSQVYINYDL